MRPVRALPRGGPRRRGARDQALRRRRRAGAHLNVEAFKQRLEGSFPGDLGIEVIRVEPGEVEGRLAIDQRHLHPGGYVHGGVWVAFADSIAAWGTYANLAEGQDFTTAELKANVFAAGRPGDILRGVGRPLHVGRRTQVWEVLITRNDEDRNAAFFSCTQMVIGASGASA